MDQTKEFLMITPSAVRPLPILLLLCGLLAVGKQRFGAIPPPTGMEYGGYLMRIILKN